MRAGRAQSLLLLGWFLYLSATPVASLQPLPSFSLGFDWQGAVNHLVATTIIGCAVAYLARREAWAHRLLLVLPVLTEAIQLFVPERHATAVDLVWNWSGFQIGWFIAKRIPVATPRGLRAMGIGFVVACCTLGSLAVLAVPSGNLLSSWDAHRLLVGNEDTGDRPWLGRIAGLAFYPKALEPGLVRALSEEPHAIDLRRHLGPLVLYSMRGGTEPTIRDQSPIAPEAPLFIETPGAALLEDGVLNLREVAMVRTAEPAAKIVDGVEDAFSVEVSAGAARSAQDGPARIVSLSQDPNERNFTLGQSGDALEFRVRTMCNDRNGTRVVGSWPGVFRDPGIHHIVAVYDRGRVGLYVDGEARGAWQRLPWGPPILCDLILDPAPAWLPFVFSSAAVVWVALVRDRRSPTESLE